MIRKLSYDQYRDKVREVYDGPQGALLSTASMLSLHIPLGERLFRKGKFDLSTVRRVLDVGSGAGQIAQHLLKYAPADASISCFDLSAEMLRRADQRLKSQRPHFIAGDLSCLPFADGAFDCVTCGYVLEHLPSAHDGLNEIARVLMPGGRVFLLTTEDSISGAWTSRLWRCRTYNRDELLKACDEVGLHLVKDLWFTAVHKAFRAGGICVELQKAR
ncbi:MAG: class I SAM-dependent methyltransferase [Planctomycetales bacterium]|nr:class I SAM-dependent methyltransferase [Planctomycetales bacterium]